MPRHATLILLCVLLTALLPARTLRAQTTQPEIIGYVFPNLPGDRPLTAADIHPAQLTRINYAFALIRNGQVVEGTPNDTNNLNLLVSLKAANPRLRVVISVGGWLGSGGFSDVALTPASRARFVDSAAAFVTRYHLDGLDIDWEYPGQPGAGNRFRPEDGANLNLLLRDLRARFDALGAPTHQHLLMSIAAGSNADWLTHTDMGGAARYLDQVNLMAYDFYEPGPTPRPTGNHAPLFADPADPRHASSAAAVAAFLQAGVPASKLVLGVPFYGHLWGNVSNTNHGLFQTGVAVPGTEANYDTITSNLLPRGFTRYWDEASQVPYAYSETAHQFVSYEDPESLRHKCDFVEQQHLGGIMFWQYLSDQSGTLLDTIHAALYPPASATPAIPAPASPITQP